jgi:hypothetical protein
MYLPKIVAFFMFLLLGSLKKYKASTNCKFENDDTEAEAVMITFYISLDANRGEVVKIHLKIYL